MNRSDARATKTPHGYIGEYRVVWRSGYQPVLMRDGNGRAVGPRYFETRDAAECAAWREKNDLEQPVMTRGGCRVEGHRSAAERLFGKDDRKAVEA